MTPDPGLTAAALREMAANARDAQSVVCRDARYACAYVHLARRIERWAREAEAAERAGGGWLRRLKSLAVGDGLLP